MNDYQKKLRKRAARLRARQRRAGEDVSPIEVWMHRVEAAGPADILQGFSCRSCGAHVGWMGGGTEHRNHCPVCLCSVHLDLTPGDRSADCGGVMEPVAVWVRKDGEWAVIHRCRMCGGLSSNRIAADDNEFVLLSIAVRPMANPPFPLERLTSNEPPH